MTTATPIKAHSRVLIAAWMLTSLLYHEFTNPVYAEQINQDTGKLVITQTAHWNLQKNSFERIAVWNRLNQSPADEIRFRKAKPILNGSISNLVIATDGQQFYSNINGHVILAAHTNHADESLFYKNNREVRCLALDDNDNLYFSSATGAKEDGTIYVIRHQTSRHPVKADPICTVHLKELQGHMGRGGHFWQGDFAFGRVPGGGIDTKTLYLTSGMVPSDIYRMTRNGESWNKPEIVYSSPESIWGLTTTAPNEIYFISLNKLYHLVNWTNPEEVLSIPGFQMGGVAVVPAGAVLTSETTGYERKK